MAFEKTRVSTDRTQHEITVLLESSGADDIIQGRSNSKSQAFIECVMRARRLRFSVTLPNPDDFKFETPRPRERKPRERSAATQKEKYEQACRQQWRRLKLLILAKIEYLKDSSIEMFDTEFGGYVIMPNGSTLAEMVHPVLNQIAEGKVPGVLKLGKE